MSFRKPSEQRERRYVVEYVRTRYPERPVLYNVRLGDVPSQLAGVALTGPASRNAMNWARYADALVILPDRLVLIEAKLPMNAEAVAQLLLYKDLVKDTKVLGVDGLKPVALEIVTPVADPALARFAQSHGINVVLFATQWALDYTYAKMKGRPGGGLGVPTAAGDMEAANGGLSA